MRFRTRCSIARGHRPISYAIRANQRSRALPPHEIKVPIVRPAPALCRVVAVDVVNKEQDDPESSSSGSIASFVCMPISLVH